MALRGLINRLWLNPAAKKPFQYRGDFRTPAPGSQKPREFSLEAADKTEAVGSIYYFPRGKVGRPNPQATLEVDPIAQTLVSPKQLRIAQQKAEQERVRAEAIAAGKKPADPPSTANITPIVEFRELEVDLKAIPDWKSNPALQCPPAIGRRPWSVARGENPNIDYDYHKNWSKLNVL